MQFWSLISRVCNSKPSASCKIYENMSFAPDLWGTTCNSAGPLSACGNINVTQGNECIPRGTLDFYEVEFKVKKIPLSSVSQTIGASTAVRDVKPKVCFILFRIIRSLAVFTSTTNTGTCHRSCFVLHIDCQFFSSPRASSYPPSTL